jgi:hypothetical protein
VLRDLTQAALPVWIRGTDVHTRQLCARFERAPKPMYYPEEFLLSLGESFRAERGLAPEEVDPDAFARHGFEALIAHRLPRYRAIAERWGVTVEAEEIAALRDPLDFDDLIVSALARR